MFDRLSAKVLSGERLTAEEAHYCFAQADLMALGRLAQWVRFQKHPEARVTFVIDSNPNYTNVCVADCLFCAFYRRPGDKETYTLTVAQVMDKIGQAVSQGATTVLLQGGLNPELPLGYYTDLIRETRRLFPTVTPHFFTATEVLMMAEVSQKSVGDVLATLKEAGQVSLPGGGAEVLTEYVRRRISPKKNPDDGWVVVHREAHRQGFKSTATMMYGHVDRPVDWVEHLTRVRDLQDEFGGFTAFIPWSFKPGNTVLEKKVPVGAGPSTYLRMLAVSRIFLDNVPHIQASWFSEGKKVGQIALHFGADDFGGTLIDENVHKATGHVNTTTLDYTIQMIQEAGFDAVQRTTLYDELKTYPRERAAELVAR
jgi:cyclic dehypoxanthinyl futalosine synthase